MFHIQQFSESYLAKGYANKTIQGDQRELQRFEDWVQDQDLDQAVKSYLQHLNQKNLSPSTIRFRIQSLKRYFKWEIREGLRESNPTEGLELPKLKKTFRMPLSESQVEQVLNLPDRSLNGLRVRAILETSYSTGLRAQELASLQLKDLDPRNGLLTVRQGKYRQDRVVPIGERAVHWVMRYLDEVRPRIVKQPSPSLFLTSKGKPYTQASSLATLVRRYLNQAQITQPGACHLFRRSAATHMLNHGANLRHIQAYLGHRNLSTTVVYTHLTCQELKAVLQRCHPAER